MEFCITGSYWYVPQIKIPFEGVININGCNRISGQTRDILGLAEIKGYYSRLSHKNFYFFKQYLKNASSRYASPDPIFFSFSYREEKNLGYYYQGSWQIIADKKHDSKPESPATEPDTEREYPNKMIEAILHIIVASLFRGGNPKVGECQCVLSKTGIENAKQVLKKPFQ
ncbi:MAG: hypothetical protein PHD96_01715 [Candidatus Pacebacteria bacterium]|nr:hypothetical protein [Candidatus Paceibacterota bacterium]